ncbi:MAG: hypothetical protein NUV91_09740 [Candidatus Omnitrophica bacterium]|nr:hypothetical protein [Candidatus Omnitrophota bacterium]
MDRKKSVLLLVLLVLAAFANILSHDLFGDTQSIFLENTFYRNPAHITHLFQKDFNMDPTYLSTTLEGIAFSGCISYRPVTALSFFADWALWKDKPYGYAWDNILLHMLVTIAVFYLILRLTGQERWAFLAAAMFAVHPIQSEAVNNVGYRSDMLCALFFVLSFLSYLQWRQRSTENKKGNAWLAASFLTFLPALFSKETAVTLPAVIVAYEFLRHQRLTRSLLKPFLGFTGILAFYFYIYLVVMPSRYYPKFFQVVENWGTHFVDVIYIFFQYLKALFLPFTVSILPPLYLPQVDPAMIGILFGGFTLFMILIVIFIFKTARPAPLLALGTMWFLVTYLPGSHLVPLPNPLAFRFLYLPSIGFFLVLSFFVFQAISWLEKKSPNIRWSFIVPMALIGWYLVYTIPTNEYFKNNIVVCREMVRRYPDSSRPYWILGLKALERQNHDQAIDYFEKYRKTHIRSPFHIQPDKDFLTYFMLGRAYALQAEKAVAFLEKSIELNPSFAAGYLELARIHISQKKFTEAIQLAEKAIAIDPAWSPGYIYVIHSYVELGEFKKAQAFLGQVKSLAPSNADVQQVEQFFQERKLQQQEGL